ncbi:helicase associated domain-containing protein [Pseudarthrobacter sp. H3Y2-7]|uniref:helicase associated domain-containing protein n=1 Tax=Pseudarthrobacter naphthalenicus TaxID=3031328 RepID=UPI0023B0FE2F|nr:helicase associated domain-containing protein [Pseudarthrobacter sp. H3Y2-7]MDE8670792.1 helicase associated domain-containing protein [Pseudarthrobacter sp. H3Y2-7]
MKTQIHRKAPEPEWVLMYRKGLPPTKIAAVTGAPLGTVRYHLGIAAQAEPGLRAEHKAARGAVTRETSRGLQNMADTITFYEKEGRLPTTGGKPARERALGAWLTYQRNAAAAGTLSPAYRGGLAVIPDWNTPPTRTEENAARWNLRLAELVKYRKAGNDWPLHKKTSTEEEWVLGVWLHGQRINHRNGILTRNRKAQLNSALPGWREGRARSGGRRAGSPPM